MFRTGPIRSFTSAEITVVACVLAIESPIPTDHDISFSVVSLDRKPVLLHSENSVVTSGDMIEFQTTLARSVRNWEVRIKADPDPDLVFVTIYHLLDGQAEPNLTFRAGELYYVDLFELDSDTDGTADFFLDFNHPFLAQWDSPSNWPGDGEDDDHPSWR